MHSELNLSTLAIRCNQTELGRRGMSKFKNVVTTEITFAEKTGEVNRRARCCSLRPSFSAASWSFATSLAISRRPWASIPADFSCTCYVLFSSWLHFSIVTSVIYITKNLLEPFQRVIHTIFSCKPVNWIILLNYFRMLARKCPLLWGLMMRRWSLLRGSLPILGESRRDSSPTWR